MPFDPTEPYEVIDAGSGGVGPLDTGSGSSVSAAVGGFDPNEPFETVDESEPQRPDELESLLRGTSQGVTMGFADEIRGYGEAMLDFGKEALEGKAPPTEVGPYIERYKQKRDKSRADSQAAEDANPNSYLAGEIGGSVASAFLPGIGALNAARNATLAETAVKGALQGTLGGLGHSEGKNSREVMADTGVGAGVGAVAGGAGHVAVNAVKKPAREVAEWVADGPVGSVIDAGVEKAKAAAQTVSRGMSRGSREANAALGTDSVVLGMGGAVVGLLREIRDTLGERKALSELAEQGRQVLGASADDVPDDAIIVASIMDDGPNPVKSWLAEKAATLYPGQIQSEKYRELLELGADARRKARSFDATEAGRALKPEMEAAEDSFRGVKSRRWQELEGQAKKSFDATGSERVFSEIEEALIESKEAKSIPGRVTAALEDAREILAQGKGLRRDALRPGFWVDANNAEKFQRLQKARELVDEQIDWAKANQAGRAQQVLLGVRDELDNALKVSPQKIEADEFYGAAKSVEGRFFDPTDFRSGGETQIDAYKIQDLLSDTNRGKRFMDAVAEYKAFANDPGLKPAERAKWARVAAKIEEAAKTAGDKRSLSSFRQAQGPTSPALERFSSASAGNTLLKDAVQHPSGFLNQMDEFVTAVEARSGKAFAQMTPEERRSAVRFWIWQKKHPDAGPERTDRVFQMIFGGSNAP
jgi:hypothetical protein